MTVPTLSRSQRAMQIERRTRNQWTPARVGIHMPSQTQRGVSYTVTLDSCTCPDHTYRLIVCKHMLAARIFLGRNL